MSPRKDEPNEDKPEYQNVDAHVSMVESSHSFSDEEEGAGTEGQDYPPPKQAGETPVYANMGVNQREKVESSPSISDDEAGEGLAMANLNFQG